MLARFSGGLRRRARVGLRAGRADRRRGAVAPRGLQGRLEHVPLRRRAAGRSTRSRPSTGSTGPGRCAAPPRPTATCSCASPASPPTSSCCSSSTTPAPRSPRCPRSTTGASGAGRLEDEPEADGPRVRPPDGRAPRRPDPAAADLAAVRRGADALAWPRRRRWRCWSAGDDPRRRRRRRHPRHRRWPCASRRPVPTSRCSSAVPSLGGLAGGDGLRRHRVDRFYHVVVPSDERMLALADEVGLADQVRFSPVGVGFYIDGEMYPFNGIGDFLRFPPLSPLRARPPGVVRAQCQLRRCYEALDDMPLDRWLRRHCGQRGDRPHLAPAAGLPLRRPPRRAARDLPVGAHEPHAQRPHLRRAPARRWAASTAATSALIEAARRPRPLARGRRPARRRRRGPRARDDGAVRGVRGRRRASSRSTSRSRPCSRRRCASCCRTTCHHLLDAYPQRYLGVVCLVLKLRRSLLPYYSVNICDPTPITTVVETSHVVGTEHTDGLRLVYLPKYCEAGAPEFREDDRSIYDRFTDMLARLAPDFRHEDVVDWTVQRAPLVEPVHARGTTPARGAGVAGRRRARARLGEPDLPAPAQRRLRRADGRADGRGGRRAARPAGSPVRGLGPRRSARARSQSRVSTLHRQPFIGLASPRASSSPARRTGRRAARWIRAAATRCSRWPTGRSCFHALEAMRGAGIEDVRDRDRRALARGRARRRGRGRRVGPAGQLPVRPRRGPHRCAAGDRGLPRRPSVRAPAR